MATDLNIISAGKSDIGKVRSANQDSILVDDQESLYIVADGMGGHAGGEIASQLCITKVQEYLALGQGDIDASSSDGSCNILLQSLLGESINHASAKIYEKALEEPNLKGMGTTATVLKIHNQHAYLAHVGDSRLYLVRCGFIYQLTHDHSLVSEQVRAGLLTREEAELHHLRNVITRSVGYQEEEDVDTLSLPVESDDLFMICSDGLHGKMTDKEIAHIIKENQLDAVPKLIDTANERGGDDNISVVLLKIQVLPTSDR